MRALVVYESMFGCTQAIAAAVADGLSVHVDAGTVEVGSAPTSIRDDVALLVVGGPTHAFGLSRPGTRRTAAEQAGAGLVSTGVGLREWFGTVHSGAGRAAAAFDTRIGKPRLPGSAAGVAGRRLRRLGYRLIAQPASFYVEGTPGPLLTGEAERARQWGESLGSELIASQPRSVH